jgi:hypothetical protein
VLRPVRRAVAGGRWLAHRKADKQPETLREVRSPSCATTPAPAGTRDRLESKLFSLLSPLVPLEYRNIGLDSYFCCRKMFGKVMKSP